VSGSVKLYFIYWRFLIWWIRTGCGLF